MIPPNTRLGPHPSEVSFVTSAPRPTPTPQSARFAEVLARNAGSLARSAEAAMRALPGTSMVALALRAPPGGGPAFIAPSALGAAGAIHGGSGAASSIRGGSAGGPSNASPEGPGGGALVGPGLSGDPALESSLSQAQEMNLYYLRVQETMNAQNRTYSALSNVLKAQHDTVKNAISNIR